MEQKLIFVYNADSSLEHQLFDFLHKAISPATYPCSLCSITYGTFGMKREWKQFIEGLGIPVEFLYRNQFRRYYGNFKTTYPAILLAQASKLEVLLDDKALNQLDLAGLQRQLTRKLKQKGMALDL